MMRCGLDSLVISVNIGNHVRGFVVSNSDWHTVREEQPEV